MIKDLQSDQYLILTKNQVKAIIADALIEAHAMSRANKAALLDKELNDAGIAAKESKHRVELILKIIKVISDQSQSGVAKRVDILNEAGVSGVSEESTERILFQLKREGRIFENPADQFRADLTVGGSSHL